MSSSSQYRVASDGYPARVSGAWAREKLYYVERYFTIFNKGMYRKWASRTYVDLMAGPGRCITSDLTDEFDGSPLLALKSEPAFERCAFVEADADLRTALQVRTEAHSDRAEVLSGDCNAPEVIERIRATLPPAALGIAFADMLGLDVWFATLDSLTQDRPMDLLITLQVNDLTRNAEGAFTEEHPPERFDRFFGATEWRDVVQRYRAQNASSQETAVALTRFYEERLATSGYPHVHELHVLMKNTRTAPLYRLILAARHQRAVDFFTEISKIEYSGQRGLL